jgi:hypothetical protein
LISFVYSAPERKLQSNLKSSIQQFNDLDDVSEMSSKDSNFIQLDDENEKTWRHPLSDNMKKLPYLNADKKLRKSQTDSLLHSQHVKRFNYDPRRSSMYPADNQYRKNVLDTEDHDYNPSVLMNNPTFRAKSRSKSLCKFLFKFNYFY